MWDHRAVTADSTASRYLGHLRNRLSQYLLSWSKIAEYRSQTPRHRSRSSNGGLHDESNDKPSNHEEREGATCHFRSRFGLLLSVAGYLHWLLWWSCALYPAEKTEAPYASREKYLCFYFFNVSTAIRILWKNRSAILDLSWESKHLIVVITDALIII